MRLHVLPRLSSHGLILHLASLGADVADPLATDRSRVHKLCINAARVGLESRTMEQPVDEGTKARRKEDAEESERSRPKGREGRRREEDGGKNRADGERGMKAERELSRSESHRPGSRECVHADMCATHASSRSSSHFSPDVFTRVGGNGLVARAYVAISSRAKPADASLHRAMWNARRRRVSALFIAIRHLFVPRRTGAPVLTLVRAALARLPATYTSDTKPLASSDGHRRNASVHVRLQIDARDTSRAWYVHAFAPPLSNKHSQWRRRRRRILSKDYYFQYSSAPGTRLYLRACTWHRGTRNETSVGRPVGSRPVSLRNRESIGSRAKPVARGRKKMRWIWGGDRGNDESRLSLVLDGIYRNRVFPR